MIQLAATETIWQEDIVQPSGKFKEGSHIKIYLPNLPYLAISHDINGALLRPAENSKGWVYDLATSHKNTNDQIWEFNLRQGVSFQDGTAFNADAVLLNMDYFKKQPYLFSKLHQVLDRVEKVSAYKIRFHLKEPYGIFLQDAVWLQFYTKTYLEKFGWNGKPTCPNLAEPGLYGLGPYILKEGYIEGNRSSAKAVLEANPNYWGKKAKIEKITIYTKQDLNKSMNDIMNKEGELDLCPIPFSREVETVQSPHAKLLVTPSLNNYAMHINMINADKALMDNNVRYIINHCIDQEILLNLSMLGEGLMSPTMVSPLFYRVGDVIKNLDEKGVFQPKKHLDSIEKMAQYMRNLLDKRGQKTLPLKLLLQKSYSYLVPDLKYFMSLVNIELIPVYAEKESDVFTQLFKTHKSENETAWDLLLWGNYDWFKHPWAAFFVYRPFNAWSTLPPNPTLSNMTDQIFKLNVESKDYTQLLGDLITYVYQNNLMVYLPTPNNVFAANKEVYFKPGKSAYVYLRDLEVSDWHWSLRKNKPLPPERQKPYMMKRYHAE